MANVLVIKASLNPNSKSARFADIAVDSLKELNGQHHFELLDLKQVNLPLCDGGQCFTAPELADYQELLKKMDGVFIAAPIYNYDVNAALKNFIELTGQAWKEKVLAMAFHAGGERSYMSAMSFMNSMMLDFRCLIVPNFVYASDYFIQSEEGQKQIEIRMQSIMKKFVSLCEWKQSFEKQ
ncbi:NAD(P)H-dependent oxidoreductase [bacterium]|nr:NAD(P)H-dependent oxidoreductase [bacterium]